MAGGQTCDYLSLWTKSSNATGSMVATTTNAQAYAQALWNANPDTGQYRYYGNCLYLLGLLMLSGNYVAW